MRIFFNRFLPLFNEAPPEGGGGGGTPPPDGQQQGGTPPTQYDPNAFLKPDLSFADGYQDLLGEHAKGLTFKTLPDVFKSVREGTATISKLTQERAELTKKLEASAGQAPAQLPADAASYRAAIQIPDKLPEGVVVPDHLLDAAATYALEHKISPEVTSRFVEFQIQQAAAEAKANIDGQFARVEKAKAEIAELVGPQNYEKTIADARAAHDLLGLNLTPDDLVQNTTLVVSLAKLSSKLQPATLKGLGIGKEGMTGESKLSQAQDILNNPANPLNAAFYDNSHPQHHAALDNYNRLILESGGSGSGSV